MGFNKNDVRILRKLHRYITLEREITDYFIIILEDTLKINQFCDIFYR